MLPTDRIAYSAITERPQLSLPDGARMAVWVIVNVEEWDPGQAMPRTVLTPPAGGSPMPDIPNWAWHEYGNRVGFWRFVEVFDALSVPAVLAINGSALAAYPAIVRAALDREWDFIGHGFTFASNNSPYFVTSAFLGDYLGTIGKPELLGAALGWLNGSQLLAMAGLFLIANRLQMRAWPFLVFGPTMLAAFLVMMVFVTSSVAIVAATAVIGIAGAVSTTAILALPLFLSSPADLQRSAAGMFTISYSCAIIIPTIGGALWDLTGKPWTAFVPLCFCAVALAVLGTKCVGLPKQGD
jgi:hypothetical protein